MIALHLDFLFSDADLFGRDEGDVDSRATNCKVQFARRNWFDNQLIARACRIALSEIRSGQVREVAVYCASPIATLCTAASVFHIHPGRSVIR